MPIKGRFDNSISYRVANEDLRSVGVFVNGANSIESGNKIDQWNNTLVFAISNPTTSKKQVNLFGFTNTLFQPPTAINPPPSVLQPILSPVGGGPDDAAYCPVNDFVYTADPISNTIEVVDTATNTVALTIPAPVGFNPYAIAYCPVNNQMYVGSSAFPLVIRIDCATNTIVGAPIVTTVAIQRAGLTYNSIKNSMYVVGLGGPAMCEINCVTNLSSPFFVVVGALFMQRAAFNPTLNRIYVTDSAANFIFTIDCATNTTIFGFATGLVGTQGIAFCSSNNSVYILGNISNNAIALNTNTNVFSAILPLGALSPADICYNPINNILYVVNSTSNDVVTINPITNAVSAPIFLAITTAFIAVYNSGDNAVAFLSNGAGFGEYIALNPLFAPQAVVVLNGTFTLGDLFNDFLGKPVILKGMRMITDNINQFGNNISIQYISVTGAVDSLQFQPLNYVSPSNAASNVIDVRSEFGVDVKPPDTNFIFDIEPLTSLILSLKITRAVDNTVPLVTDKNISEDWGAGTDKTTAINMTGNPIADHALKMKADNILSESGYNSLVQYAFYPNLTGNPIADAALLDAAGFKYDH